MTTPVPHFPGKPAQVGTQPPKEPWAQSACPYSLSGAISRLGPVQENLVAIVGVQKPSDDQRAIVPLPCIGPRCALFMSTKLANGQEVSGCSHVMQVLETNRVSQLLARFLDALAESQAPEETLAVPPAPPAAG